MRGHKNDEEEEVEDCKIWEWEIFGLITISKTLVLHPRFTLCQAGHTVVLGNKMACIEWNTFYVLAMCVNGRWWLFTHVNTLENIICSLLFTSQRFAEAMCVCICTCVHGEWFTRVSDLLLVRKPTWHPRRWLIKHTLECKPIKQ